MKFNARLKMTLGWLMAAGVLVAAPWTRAEEPDYKGLYEEQKKRNDNLEKRVAALETKPAAAPEADGGISDKMKAFLGAVELSGFVSASYFYNFNQPSTDQNTGRTYDISHDEFALNKFKLVLENPIAYSADNWDAGFRADLIVGQDAKHIHSAGLFTSTDDVDLEQAFVAFNVPVGNGLQVSIGKWVTLMGLEVIEEVANPNWSEGNQFLFVENFTATGVQFSYKWNDKLDTQFRITNGWDVTKDNNSGKSLMARVGYVPDDKTAISLVGYAGPEQTNDSANWRSGVNLVLNRRLTPKLNSWLQLDYGQEDAGAALAAASGNAALATEDASWWAAGLWLTYDCSEKVGLALRADYVDDTDGARTSGSPVNAPFPANTGHELYSLTLTLNWKPVSSLQIRPEIRYDHSSISTAFDGHDDQVTAGIGVAFLY